MFGRMRIPVERPPLGDLVSEIVDDAAEAALAARREQALTRLRAIVDEAVIRQDQADAVLREIRDRAPLARVAREGGAIASRFLRLRADLPAPGRDDPLVGVYVAAVDEVLYHHAMLVSSSLDFLAVNWRSERIVDQLERLDGLGEPGRRLDAIRAELHELTPARASASPTR